jgi:hypothetical protein
MQIRVFTLANSIMTNKEHVQINLIHNVRARYENQVNSQLQTLFPVVKGNFMLEAKLIIIVYIIM